ncbi:MAG: hypothetical protein V4813_10505 [Gemmatimonadota bacterium]
MQTAVLISVGICGISRAADAQGASVQSAAESAALARRLSGEASTLLAAGDTVTAHRRMIAATDAWPAQPLYFWRRAQFAAAARDTADVLIALTRFTAMGMTRDIATDRLLATFRTLPSMRPITAALAANAAPIVRSRVRLTLPDSSSWPEGLAYDARTKRWFVTSVRHGTIVIADATGSRALWPERPPRVGAMLAVALDPDGRHLWATTAGIPQLAAFSAADSTIAALLKVRIGDGAIVQRFDLPPVAARHMLGDVVIGPNGDLFISDSQDPTLHRLRRGATALESFTDPLFRSLQGIAPANENTVYVADYSHGLLRVDLRTRQVTRLHDAADGASLGVDGLAWYRGSLIGVQNGVAPARIVRFHLDATGTRIARQELLDRNAAVADEPTIGVVVGDEYVYVANSQWEKHDDAGRRRPGTTLAPTILLALPLTR